MVLSARDEADVLVLFADAVRSLLSAEMVIVGAHPDVEGELPAAATYVVSSPSTDRGAGVEWTRDMVDPVGKLNLLATCGGPVLGTGTLTESGLLARHRGPWVVAPLALGVGRIGFVCVVRSMGAAPFSAEGLATLDTFCARTAYALGTLRLRAAEDDQVKFHERHRIARELHDLTLQRIFGVGMLLETGLRLTNGECVPADRAAAAIEEINEAIAEMRRAIEGFEGEPPPVGAAEIEATVRREIGRQALRFDTPPTITIALSSRMVAERDTMRALTAAVREGLSNAARHTACDSVAVDLVTRGHRLVLTMVNEGTGRDCACRGGRGISNLSRRARDLGGRCEFVADQDRATLTWWVPVDFTTSAERDRRSAGG
jgi:signal transduction histidine kinase